MRQLFISFTHSRGSGWVVQNFGDDSHVGDYLGVRMIEESVKRNNPDVHGITINRWEWLDGLQSRMDPLPYCQGAPSDPAADVLEAAGERIGTSPPDRGKSEKQDKATQRSTEVKT